MAIYVLLTTAFALLCVAFGMIAVLGARVQALELRRMEPVQPTAPYPPAPTRPGSGIEALRERKRIRGLD